MSPCICVSHLHSLLAFVSRLQSPCIHVSRPQFCSFSPQNMLQLCRFTEWLILSPFLSSHYCWQITLYLSFTSWCLLCNICLGYSCYLFLLYIPPILIICFFVDGSLPLSSTLELVTLYCCFIFTILWDLRGWTQVFFLSYASDTVPLFPIYIRVLSTHRSDKPLIFLLLFFFSSPDAIAIFF